MGVPADCTKLPDGLQNSKEEMGNMWKPTRQRADNQERFDRMAEKIRQIGEAAYDPQTKRAALHEKVILHAIREVDARTLDTRTVQRWLHVLEHPPRSISKQAVINQVGPHMYAVIPERKPQAKFNEIMAVG
jgi:hypothetical protein